MICFPGPFSSIGGLLSSAYFPIKKIKSPKCGLIVMEGLAARPKKGVWLWTKSKEVLTISVETGWDTFVFTPETKQLIKDWASIAKIRPLFFEDKKILNDQGKQIALLGEVTCAEDLRHLKSLSNRTDIVVMDAVEWQIINSENMVASFQNMGSLLYAVARSAKEAQIFFESLEKGTDGIILKTEEIGEVLELKAYVSSQSTENIELTTAIIQRVDQIGTGDRVCVDLCSILRPGEGLLVGSFARGLFLVHSECLETEYVASRPFRVNAGPVHAYVGLPGGRTSYLSELHTGMQVLVVDENGFQRSVAVGRVKIETRPLMLIEARLENDPSLACSLLLQNAETVSLVCPRTGKDTTTNTAIPVTSLKAGDKVLLSLQDSARHTAFTYRSRYFCTTRNSFDETKQEQKALQPHSSKNKYLSSIIPLLTMTQVDWCIENLKLPR